MVAGFKAGRLRSVIQVAKLFDVPPRILMGEEMYDNWRRRLARLDRAHSTATTAQRRRAVRLARRRLGGTL